MHHQKSTETRFHFVKSVTHDLTLNFYAPNCFTKIAGSSRGCTAPPFSTNLADHPNLAVCARRVLHLVQFFFASNEKIFMVEHKEIAICPKRERKNLRREIYELHASLALNTFFITRCEKCGLRCV